MGCSWPGIWSWPRAGFPFRPSGPAIGPGSWLASGAWPRWRLAPGWFPSRSRRRPGRTSLPSRAWPCRWRFRWCLLRQVTAGRALPGRTLVSGRALPGRKQLPTPRHSWRTLPGQGRVRNRKARERERRPVPSCFMKICCSRIVACPGPASCRSPATGSRGSLSG